MTKVLYAIPVHVGDEAYTVSAALGAGRVVYHNGPAGFPYFTKDQAERLAARVSGALAIDLAHWDDGSFPDMTVRDLEDEFYSRAA